jgi:hypothetical protein
MEPDEVIFRICEFLDRIGVPYQECDIPEKTFLPGLTIQGGKVKVDRSRLTYPGDLLHEAGHVALTRASQRPTISQEALDAQDPRHSEEMAFLLWTYLASKEIGLPPEAIFHAGGYKGNSSWLVGQFESGSYIGLPLLTWMGVTEQTSPGVGLKVKSWLRVSGE